MAMQKEEQTRRGATVHLSSASRAIPTESANETAFCSNTAIKRTATNALQLPTCAHASGPKLRELWLCHPTVHQEKNTTVFPPRPNSPQCIAPDRRMWMLQGAWTTYGVAVTRCHAPRKPMSAEQYRCMRTSRGTPKDRAPEPGERERERGAIATARGPFPLVPCRPLARIPLQAYT
jgi:hypothetical protein